jgi:hypothetical protein
MPEKPIEFREQLLDAQEMTPALRDSYQKQLDAMLHPPLTWRSRSPGILLLVILVACIGGLVRNLIVLRPGVMVQIGWVTLLGVFAYSSMLIIRSLWIGKHVRKWGFSIAGAFYCAAGVLTAIAMLKGLNKPADPGSTFHALFMFIFLVVCLGWALQSRIERSELTLREHLLRVESRLADLAERLPK